MKFCGNCGAKLDEKDDFCGGCGAPSRSHDPAEMKQAEKQEATRQVQPTPAPATPVTRPGAEQGNKASNSTGSLICAAITGVLIALNDSLTLPLEKVLLFIFWNPMTGNICMAIVHSSQLILYLVEGTVAVAGISAGIRANRIPDQTQQSLAGIIINIVLLVWLIYHMALIVFK
jgi:hypothetical protein